MIRVPDWAFEAAGQETRGMGQDTASYHPGLYLTPAQVVLVNVCRLFDFILELMQSSRYCFSLKSRVNCIVMSIN